MAQEPTTNPRIEELKGRLSADPKSRLFYPLAEEHRKIKQYSEAERILRAGLENHSGYLSAWISLGRVLKELGRNSEAVGVLEKALTIDPENVVAARLAAENYETLGEHVEAIKKYKLVRALHPADDEVEELIIRLEEKIHAPDLAETERVQLPRVDVGTAAMPVDATVVPSVQIGSDAIPDEPLPAGEEPAATMPFEMGQPESERTHEPDAESILGDSEALDHGQEMPAEPAVAPMVVDSDGADEGPWIEPPLAGVPASEPPEQEAGAALPLDGGADLKRPEERPEEEAWPSPEAEPVEPEPEVPWSAASPEGDEPGAGPFGEDDSETGDLTDAAKSGLSLNRRKIARLQGWLEKVSVRVDRV